MFAKLFNVRQLFLFEGKYEALLNCNLTSWIILQDSKHGTQFVRFLAQIQPQRRSIERYSYVIFLTEMQSTTVITQLVVEG